MPLFDALEEVKAEVVWVDATDVGADHLVVRFDEGEVDLRWEIELMENGVVPVAGPALIHDLRLDLRPKVPPLIPAHLNDVSLPCGYPPVLRDEAKDIVIWFEGIVCGVEPIRLRILLQFLLVMIDDFLPRSAYRSRTLDLKLYCMT
jgi:hypothetical protein